jgi:uncharacterized protein YcsI (UPF0317 family)
VNRYYRVDEGSVDSVGAQPVLDFRDKLTPTTEGQIWEFEITTSSDYKTVVGATIKIGEVKSVNLGTIIAPKFYDAVVINKTDTCK